MAQRKRSGYIMIDYTVIKQLNELGIDNGNEVILYSLIKNLCKKNNQCTPTNGFLAEVMCCTERNIQKLLRDLKDRGLINTYDNKVGDYSHRVIYLSKDLQKG